MTTRTSAPETARTPHWSRSLVAMMLITTLATTGLVASTQQAVSATTTTPLMRANQLTPQQMAEWFKQEGPGGYRASVPVELLAAYYYFESQAEGVAGDLAFAQAILETSWFRWPSYGQVAPSHNNFAGIGACDGGTCTVASFPTARIGVRAQIQHLRAYGDPTVTVDNLAYPLESPRFHLVTPKGKAPTWEQMGNGNWATDPEYSNKVLNIYGRMLAFAKANPDMQGTYLYRDVAAGSRFDWDIAALAMSEITRGCNPPTNDRFCPADTVTRGQMASFLVRATDLQPISEVLFRDVSSSNPHRNDINAIAAAGITRGCNPPANDRFCPDEPVTREQMATFLHRALGSPTGTSNSFRDVSASNPHREAIGLIGNLGITRGCNPPTNDRYCPSAEVTREQMAAFLRRAFL